MSWAWMVLLNGISIRASPMGEAVSHQMKISAARLLGHRDRKVSLPVYRDFSIRRGCAW